MGPEQFTTLVNDSSPNWTLDAGCGVATATMEALWCGLNSTISFDSDHDMVSVASQRLGNISDEPDGNRECTTIDEKRLADETWKDEEAQNAKDLAAEAQANLDEFVEGEAPIDGAPTASYFVYCLPC
ncbi:hypothetical protein CYMTET_18750 [Cymbomonas tetramitiformis]|uniref:Methyltransferase domain-containing protein n=1 Tax=Cymbomonas tetramitiformis TaxID=36881 RepID=A0AAE0G7F2_9CHLO|nr:hypothetical protein CYMTET_18750 [Cymbomonas tetramitiformis]